MSQSDALIRLLDRSRSRLREERQSRKDVKPQAEPSAQSFYPSDLDPIDGGNVEKKGRVEITLTTERTVSIKSIRMVAVLCLKCGKLAQWVALEQAALLTGAHAYEVYHLLNARKIHFVETNEGLLLICLDSLNKNNPIQNELQIDSSSGK